MDQLILSDDVTHAAQQLLGCYLVRTIDDKDIVGMIVETEAYHQTDAASHSYRGVTPRTEVMFGPAMHAYVYFTYGMHYCFNVVTGDEGEGSAVLIRAVEPIEGHEYMRRMRGRDTTTELTNGPAKLCQALAINKNFNGHNLYHSPLRIEVRREILNPNDIAAGTRIGISKDTHRQWRFWIRDNQFVSVIAKP